MKETKYEYCSESVLFHMCLCASPYKVKWKLNNLFEHFEKLKNMDLISNHFLIIKNESSDLMIGGGLEEWHMYVLTTCKFVYKNVTFSDHWVDKTFII